MINLPLIFCTLGKYHLRVDFDFGFNLICIISSMKDYRLSWAVNKLLNIGLRRQGDLIVSNAKKRQESCFNLFQYEDEMNCLRYFLIANKSSGAFLIPELKQVDYLLMLRGDVADETTSEVLQQLKTMPGVEALFTANPAELRSREKLILE